MKIRWTTDSIRVRITPPELATLELGGTIQESLNVNGRAFWTIEVAQSSGRTSLSFEDGSVGIRLGRLDMDALTDPQSEGVYLQDAPTDIRYYIEKDFPCAHPRAIESSEPVTETFAPPPGFLERKME